MEDRIIPFQHGLFVLRSIVARLLNRFGNTVSQRAWTGNGLRTPHTPHFGSLFKGKRNDGFGYEHAFASRKPGSYRGICLIGLFSYGVELASFILVPILPFIDYNRGILAFHRGCIKSTSDPSFKKPSLSFESSCFIDERKNSPCQAVSE